jgi:uncharacterized membrane protein
MKKLDIKTIASNAIIAAAYAALTLVLAPISYGSIQMRVSEIMVFFAFYNRKYIPGLVLGCLIANLPSPLGAWDICFGTLATLLAVVCIWKVKNRYLGALLGGVVNGLIVGAELTIVFKSLPFYLNALYVFIGEFAILVIGAFVFGVIEKNNAVMKALDDKKVTE